MHHFATPITSRQWALYLKAVVDIHFENCTLRITPAPRGSTRGLFPERSHRTIHVITAFNPGGRTASPGDNHRFHAALLHTLDRLALTWWPAAGGASDGSHVEESAAVVGLSEADARELGRHLGQDAVFAWTPGAWRLLSCVNSRSEERGWLTAVQA